MASILQTAFSNSCFWLKIALLKLVPTGTINDQPTLIQIMALPRTGDKPLSETRMAYITDGYIEGIRPKEP